MSSRSSGCRRAGAAAYRHYKTHFLSVAALTHAGARPDRRFRDLQYSTIQPRGTAYFPGAISNGAADLCRQRQVRSIALFKNCKPAGWLEAGRNLRRRLRLTPVLWRSMGRRSRDHRRSLTSIRELSIVTFKVPRWMSTSKKLDGSPLEFA